MQKLSFTNVKRTTTPFYIKLSWISARNLKLQELFEKFHSILSKDLEAREVKKP